MTMTTARDVCITGLQKKVTTTALVVAAVMAAVLVFPRITWAAAGNTQICTIGTNCTIGEFLYDDNYVPLITATCQITSRYPDGSLLHNATVMTVAPQADGWYSHTFTTPTTVGLYRTEVKCTTIDAQVLALDKTFEVITSSSSSLTADEIAAATWGYSGRTLSSFGTLMSDIWSSGTRTLTGAGLSSGSIATKSDLDSVGSNVSSVSTKADDIKTKVDSLTAKVETIQSSATAANERLINGPFIKYYIESDDSKPFDVEVKIEATRSVANQLAVNIKYLKSKAQLMDEKWSKLKDDEISSTLSVLLQLIGKEEDSKNNNSLFVSSRWIAQEWGWKEAEVISAQTDTVSIKVSSLKKEIEENGKSNTTRTSLKNITAEIVKLENLVGRVQIGSKDKSLVSAIDEVSILSSSIDSKRGDVKRLLANWKKNDKNLKVRVDKLSSEVTILNRLPKVKSTAKTKAEDKSKPTDQSLKNEVLGLLGILNANSQMLAQKSNVAFASTWLELGSIVFKSIITNPSNSIAQTVPLRYDLPQEVKREDIIEMDDELTIEFDSEKNNYYISGTFTLAPDESRTLSVRVDDKIFEINTSEVSTLRKQAMELSKPLKGTSYFAQGVTLQSDINVSLDNVLSLKEEATTPEGKIRSYRRAQTELNAAKVKIENLKEIVATTGSVGTMFGFVGGTQTLAVWGMIIIMVAGFVFLTLYMRVLRVQDLALHSQTLSGSVSSNETINRKQKEQKIFNNESVIEHEEKPKSRLRKTMTVGLIIVGVFGISALALSGFVGMQNSSDKKKIAPKIQAAVVSPEKKVLGTADERKTQASSSAKITVIVPEDSVVNIHKEPSLVSSVLVSLEKSQLGDSLSEEDAWTKISIMINKETIVGWIDSDFIQKVDISVTQKVDDKNIVRDYSICSERNSTVTVPDDLTGYLKVRSSAPDGEVLKKIKAGDIFPFITEDEGWVKVKLDDSTAGWISKEFVSVNL